MPHALRAAARLAAAVLLFAVACGYHGSPAPRIGPPVEWPVKAHETVAFRFVVYGDTRQGHEVHRTIIKAVEASKPDVILQTGDLVSDSAVEAQWEVFDDITKKLLSDVPYYPARGNHDNQGGDRFEKYVPTKGIRREGYYYSFDVERVHFIAIDTEEAIVEKSRQYIWLDEDMKSASAEGKFIIPYYHKAIFSVGPHAMQSDVWALRPVLHDLFKKHGVKLVFQGHDHLYYRTIRDGITYVVTGAAGAPLFSARYPQLMIPGDVHQTIWHFCIGDVFPDRVEVNAYRHDLAALDSFTINLAPPSTGPAAGAEP